MQININKNRILQAKITPNMIIQEHCNRVCNNPTPVNISEFMLNFKSLPRQTILENLSCLYKINTKQSISFLNHILENSNLSEEQLQEYSYHIKEYILENDMDESSYEDTFKLIENLIQDTDNIEKIKESIKYSLASDRFTKHYACESYYLDTELDIIAYNINYNPETITQLELLLRKIKMSKGAEYFNEFPGLLDKSTKMICNIEMNMTGDVLELVTSVPIVIAEKLSECKVPPTQAKNFIRLIDKQIITMTKTLKNNAGTQYNLYYSYLQSLQKAKEILTNRTTTKVLEHIAEMQPDVIYSDGVLEDIAAEIEDSLVDIFYDPESENDMKVMENFYKLSMKYTNLLEAKNTGVSKGVRNAANKVGNANRKVANKVVAKAHDSARVKTTISKSFDPLVNLINNTVNKIKEQDKKERTDRIVTGQFSFKLKNVIKKGIGAIALFTVTKGVVASAVNPLVGAVIGAITLYAAFGRDRKLDRKTRQKVIKDLEEELVIVNEKIDDAKGDGDKQAKYQLMRVRSQLERDIERIKFHLDE